MMIHTPKPSRPIEFSGSIEALAVSLGLPIAEVAASIAGLIDRGHLQPIGHGAYRFFPKPAR
jgi:hypothetical protein